MAGFALAPFSAVYYPIDVLPRWAQSSRPPLPMTYVFEGMRQVLRGDRPPVSDLLISFGLNFLYLALSVVFFAGCSRRAGSAAWRGCSSSNARRTRVAGTDPPPM